MKDEYRKSEVRGQKSKDKKSLGIRGQGSGHTIHNLRALRVLRGYRPLTQRRRGKYGSRLLTCGFGNY